MGMNPEMPNRPQVVSGLIPSLGDPEPSCAWALWWRWRFERATLPAIPAGDPQYDKAQRLLGATAAAGKQ
jgi:hypothetical protein